MRTRIGGGKRHRQRERASLSCFCARYLPLFFIWGRCNTSKGPRRGAIGRTELGIRRAMDWAGKRAVDAFFLLFRLDAIALTRILAFAFFSFPSQFLHSKKKQVSWDWFCESTIIYRAISYLDTYMATVEVKDLGKYQVRGKRERGGELKNRRKKTQRAVDCSAKIFVSVSSEPKKRSCYRERDQRSLFVACGRFRTRNLDGLGLFAM